jgi:hypothetical protein
MTQQIEHMAYPMKAITDCTVGRSHHPAGSTFDALTAANVASLQHRGGAKPITQPSPPPVVPADPPSETSIAPSTSRLPSRKFRSKG